MAKIVLLLQTTAHCYCHCLFLISISAFKFCSTLPAILPLPALPSSLSLPIIISSSWHHAQQTKSLEFRLRTTANDLWSPQFLDQKFKLLSRSLSKCLLMYMWDYSLHTHIVIKDQKTIYPWLTRNSLEYWFKKSNNNNNGRQNPYLPLVLNINLLPFGGAKHGFPGFRPLMF